MCSWTLLAAFGDSHARSASSVWGYALGMCVGICSGQRDYAVIVCHIMGIADMHVMRLCYIILIVPQSPPGSLL